MKANATNAIYEFDGEIFFRSLIHINCDWCKATPKIIISDSTHQNIDYNLWRLYTIPYVIGMGIRCMQSRSNVTKSALITRWNTRWNNWAFHWILKFAWHETEWHHLWTQRSLRWHNVTGNAFINQEPTWIAYTYSQLWLQFAKFINDYLNRSR